MNYKDLLNPGNNSLKQIDDNIGLIDVDSPTNIQFTSGTTGKPKGATLSHKNILNNGFILGIRTKYTQLDNICISVPLYHCFGMVMGNLAAITRGMSVTYPCRGFNAVKALEACQKYNCTSLYGVPTMFIQYLKQLQKKKYKLQHLRTGVMAGSLCPQVLMQNVYDKLNLKDLTICYGMTQTSPISFQTQPSDSLKQKTQTVGRILPNTQAKIINQQGKIAQVGKQGQIWVKGYNVMLGYWKDQQKTKQSIQDGWMKSGDIGQLDQNGYLSVVGRIKDMIIRGGQNVYPKQVEDQIRLLKQVQDVQVIGTTDTKYGQQIVALVKLKEGKKLTKQDVFNFCHGQIAHYKLPKYVKFVTSFPITVTGKAQKFKMRDQFNKQENKQQYRTR